MPGGEVKFESASIVLRGHFNPAIFQPSWFAAQGMLSREAVDAAEIQIISPQVTAFSVNEIDLQVTDDRFSIGTPDASAHEVMRDLVLGAFTVLRHTPLTMMGLNVTAHLQCTSEEAWHKLGHAVSPKGFWGNLLVSPGTRSLVVQGERPDKRAGYVQVRVEPSLRVQPGVFVDVNDHFESGATEPGAGWPVFSEIIRAEWSTSRDRATALIEHIRAQV